MFDSSHPSINDAIDILSLDFKPLRLMGTATIVF